MSDGAVEAVLARIASAERGIFLCGGGAFEQGGERSLLDLGASLGWPVLADGRAFARETDAVVVAHGDAVYRSPRARSVLRPDLVIHVGATHASRVVASYFADDDQSGIDHVLIDPHASFEDPERLVSLVVDAPPAALFSSLLASLPSRRPSRAWVQSWRQADDAAEAAIAALCDHTLEITEPGLARQVVATLPRGSSVFCSSSMPIRDVEWFAPRREDSPEILANRGANGIDGVVSTILGVAAIRGEHGPVVGLVGDLAFLYDLSGLVFGAAESPPKATIVVIDNSGGGIFSFLAYPGLVEPARFERAFGTPQSPDLKAVAQSLGARVEECSTAEAFTATLSAVIGEEGIKVVVVRTDRDENVAFHNALYERAKEAVDRVLATS